MTELENIHIGFLPTLAVGHGNDTSRVCCYIWGKGIKAVVAPTMLLDEADRPLCALDAGQVKKAVSGGVVNGGTGGMIIVVDLYDWLHAARVRTTSGACGRR